MDYVHAVAVADGSDDLLEVSSCFVFLHSSLFIWLMMSLLILSKRSPPLMSSSARNIFELLASTYLRTTTFGCFTLRRRSTCLSRAYFFFEGLSEVIRFDSLLLDYFESYFLACFCIHGVAHSV